MNYQVAARNAAVEIAREINGGDRADCTYPPALTALLDNCTIANEAALADWLESIIARNLVPASTVAPQQSDDDRLKRTLQAEAELAAEHPHDGYDCGGTCAFHNPALRFPAPASPAALRDEAETQRCPDCRGTGKGSAQQICVYCHGSGQVETYESRQQRLAASSPTLARKAAEIETHLGTLPFSLIDEIHERRQTIYRGLDYRLSPDVAAKLKTDLDYLMAFAVALRPAS